MPTATAATALEANLAAIALQDPELVERLRQVESAELTFEETRQGVPAGILNGKQLCSRHRPLDEADRLADEIDLIEHAVIVLLGFGMGYHADRVARRMGQSGLVVIFEPDLRLLRAVLERVNHADWIVRSRLVWITDPQDRGALGQRLSGHEARLGQGVHFAEHPASRWRISAESVQFTTRLREFMTSARTTLVTTLVRSIDTIRNLILNVDHYLASPDIDGFRNLARGYPAITVSAGPSLQKNMHLLTQPGVRDKCVIIAVQTVLKPLLEAGIKPHFVTALDIAPISKRFYEGLTPEDVEGITLVIEPKAHPVIADSFPGRVLCCGSSILDKLLGDSVRPMGRVLPGATVAHLSVYFARHLGCDPVVMIGQDLGFSDGLYYSSGTAIHDVWTPELNPFNTIEMMEWQRIVRNRNILHKLEDIDGKEILSDTQLVTYLAQFERDFANLRRDGVRVIDATEGGVRKQHTELMTLADALQQFAINDLPPFPETNLHADPRTTEAALKRIGTLRRDIARIADASRRTITLLGQMLEEQRDQAKMKRHFRQLEKLKREVEERPEAFALIDHLNQLGMFKRARADRRLELQKDVEPLERQRAELLRDRDNVAWIAEAAQELIDQLLAAERLLRGEDGADVRPRRRRVTDSGEFESGAGMPNSSPGRVAALVPIDPRCNGLGVARSLSEPFAGRTVLQATLERLGRISNIESIILIAPRDFDVEPLIDRSRIARPVEIERLAEGVASPFGPEHESIAAARLWSPSSWRGGIAGMSVYDEVLCPQVMHEIAERRGLTAGLLCAPDWPLIDVSDDAGGGALVARHLARPKQQRLCFTQAPPGFGCILAATTLLHDFANRNRLATFGGLMVYQPHVPQADPIATNTNITIDHRIRRSQLRATFDTAANRELLRRVVVPIVAGRDDWSTVEIIDQLERHVAMTVDDLPQHVILELCTERETTGPAQRHPYRPIRRAPADLDLAERLFAALGRRGDGVLTLDGVGDPLLHPAFDQFIRRAKDAGVRGVHVRTDLLVPRDVVDRLLESGVDVITVPFNADRAETYRAMNGVDRFREMLQNVEHIVQQQRRLTDQDGTAALPMPWLVPRIQRRHESYHDIERFFDRWQHTLGTAVIEGPPPFPDTPDCPADTLRPARMPDRYVDRELSRRMTVLCDGSAPVSELDLVGEHAIGSLREQSLAELWQAVTLKRRAWRDDPDSAPLPLRTFHP